MQRTATMKLAFVASVLSSFALAEKTNPIAKVLEMISDLQTKLLAEADKSQKIYSEFADWCKVTAADVNFEIKTSNAELESLTATIEKETSAISAATGRIDGLSADITQFEADIKQATEVRAKENKDFLAEEAELSELIGQLRRGLTALEMNNAEGDASLLQKVNIAVKEMVQASATSSADAATLASLIQSNGDDDVEPEAPAPSKDLTMDTLRSLLDRSEGLLDKAQKKEATNVQDFKLLKLSLDDGLRAANEDLADTKKNLASSKEKKSAAEGDKDVTSKDLSADKEALASLHRDCMTKAQDFEAETKSRGEELTAIAVAKKAIGEATGAATQSYGLNQVSFLQMARSKLTSAGGLSHFEAVKYVRELARKESSSVLAQLASQMAAAITARSGTEQDPFANVKRLVRDMIAKIEEQGSKDSDYCERESAKSAADEEDKTSALAKVNTKINQLKSNAVQLREEVADLQQALAGLSASQAEMNKLREEERTLFKSQKAELEKGIEGVKLALKVLRDYYAKSGKSHQAGESNGIISMLEVCESDFSKGLAEIETTESTSQETYEKETQQNEIDRAAKEQDVKYKTKEAKGLEKDATDLESDRNALSDELDAIKEFIEKLKKKCNTVDSYAQRKARRESEINGLKNALEILEGETVMLLQKSSKRNLRRSVA